MRGHRLHWLFPILVIALSACSTSQGFDRAGMQDALHQRLDLVGEREIKTPETKNAMENHPPLAGPFRLGVYFVRREFPARQSVQTMEWLSAEKDALVQRLAPLREDKIVREVTVLAEPTVLKLTRQELQQAASRYGLDLLLLVDGIGAVDRHNNAYSFFYPTIIGAWLAPGTVSDAVFVIDSRLWDVRTAVVGEHQMAEGQAQSVGAAVMVEDADVLREAKHRAIEAFGSTLVQHLRSLTQTRPNAPASLR